MAIGEFMPPERNPKEKAQDQTPPPEIRFRADIQGLRGIAVAFVLLFHAGIPGFKGGFVGVDIFFVLSGYLITGNLLRELKSTGRINFREFYARRIRRLLPASFLVLIVTLIVAAIWFPPLLLPGLALDVSSAGLYVSNIDFAFRATDYFASSVIPSPVLHFWSLGVEEQFYLFWPLLMALTTIRRRHIPAKILALSLIVLVSSLTFANWLLSRDQPWAFFSLPTRAWELILGAILASVTIRFSKTSKHVATALGIIGICLILFSGFTQDDPLKFPGSTALIPTLGAFLTIAAGSVSVINWPFRALSIKPLQYLGRISYSLYLWHWPVLVIPQVIAGNTLSIWKRAILAIFSIFLAAATEKFIEGPFKRGFIISMRPLRNIVTAGVIASLLALVAFGADYVATGGLRGSKVTASAQDQRDFIDSLIVKSTPTSTAPIRPVSVDFSLPVDLQPSLLIAGKDRPIPYADGCHTQMNLRASIKPCIFGDKTSNTTVVLFGDSHALAWFPAFNEVAKENHWKLISLTMSACTPAAINAYNRATAATMKNCPIWRSASINKIISMQPYMVLVASSRGFATAAKGAIVTGAARTARFVAGMNKTISQLESSGARVLMMSDTPALSQDPLVCLSAHPTSTLDCATPAATAISNDWIAVETQVASHNLVPLIKPQLWVCPSDPCPVVIGKILTYFDTGHMTATFSQALAGQLKSAINTALSVN